MIDIWSVNEKHRSHNNGSIYIYRKGEELLYDYGDSLQQAKQAHPWLGTEKNYTNEGDGATVYDIKSIYIHFIIEFE